MRDTGTPYLYEICVTMKEATLEARWLLVTFLDVEIIGDGESLVVSTGRGVSSLSQSGAFGDWAAALGRGGICIRCCRVTFRWDFTGQVQHPKHHCSWYILGFVLAALEAGFQTWSLEWTEVHSERICIYVRAKRNKTDRIRSESDLDIERQTPWLVRKHEKTKDKRTRTVTKGIPAVSHSLAILRSNLATQEVSDARRAPFFPEVLLHLWKDFVMSIIAAWPLHVLIA